MASWRPPVDVLGPPRRPPLAWFWLPSSHHGTAKQMVVGKHRSSFSLDFRSAERAELTEFGFVFLLQTRDHAQLCSPFRSVEYFVEQLVGGHQSKGSARRTGWAERFLDS